MPNEEEARYWRTYALVCDQCGEAYDPIACRWRCPLCGWKASCCEGEPGEPQR